MLKMVSLAALALLLFSMTAPVKKRITITYYYTPIVDVANKKTSSFKFPIYFTTGKKWVNIPEDKLSIEGIISVSGKIYRKIKGIWVNEPFVKGCRGNKLIPFSSAASKSIPYGKKVDIAGYRYIIEDTGSGLKENQVDIYIGEKTPEEYNNFINKNKNFEWKI